MRKDISTLEELEKEKEKLKMTMTVTKDALAKSLGTNRKELQSFLLNKVALPAGAIGLGTVAIKKAFSSDKSKKKEEKSSSNLFESLSGGLFPLIMNFVQAYLLKQQQENIDHKEEVSNMEATVPTTTTIQEEKVMYS